MNLLEGGVTQPGKSPSPENGTVPLVYNNIHEELSIHDSKPEKGRITHTEYSIEDYDCDINDKLMSRSGFPGRKRNGRIQLSIKNNIKTRKGDVKIIFSHPPLLVSFFFLDYKYVTVSVSGLRSKCFGKGLPVSPL